MRLSKSQQLGFCRRALGIVRDVKDDVEKGGISIGGRLAKLEEKLTLAETRDKEMELARARSMEATRLANETLSDAYETISAFILVVAGSLGHDHEIARQLRTIRPQMVRSSRGKPKRRAPPKA